MQAELLKRITIVPGLMGRKLTIRGMRFPVAGVLEMLANNMTREEILEQHPLLEVEDISASLFYASIRIKGTIVINVA